MTSPPNLKEKYTLAGCCNPTTDDPIVGYFSHNDMIKVHRGDCSNLSKADAERLVTLRWEDILAEVDFQPGPDYQQLDATDFDILRHHLELDIDYSLKVARVLNIARQETFDRHHKLRDLGLLERVEPTMVQYRKGVVKNTWIKHRNHTYYRITDRGTAYLLHRQKKGRE